MEQHVRERQVPTELDPGHDHPSDPEEQNLGSGAQSAGRVENPDILCLVRPAERAERPQPGAEPRIENIGILLDLAAARRTRFQVLPGHGDLPACGIPAIPDRDPMPPPQLPADAPVPDIRHPVFVRRAETLRMEAEIPLPECSQGRLCQRLHADEPLKAQARLHDGVATIAVAHSVDVLLDLLQQACRLEVLDDPFPRFETIQATIRLRRVLVQGRIAVHHVEFYEAVPPADLEIVRVVGRRDFDEPGPEIRIDEFIRHDRDPTPGEWQLDFTADQMGILPVGRMHGHGRVTQHRLRTCGGNRDPAPGLIGQRVSDMPQLSLYLLVLRLFVGQRRMAPGAPVDDVVAPIDQPFFVQPDEHFPHCPRQTRVESESGAVPIARAADRLELLDDRASVRVHPFPHALHERLSSEVLPRESFLLELALHDVLGRDPGVIRARYPHRVPALHSLESDEDVLDRVVQPVTHMQGSRDIRRRDRDHVRIFRIGCLDMERASIEPPFIQRRFDPRRVVPGFEDGADW